MQSEPLVSIGVPCYNRPDGLAESLTLLTEQTYRNLQIVVSDNCSSDPRVSEVAQEFAERDSRVTAHRQTENLGPLKNFEFVLGEAKGEFYMWAADDDLFDNRYVELMLQNFERHPSIGFSFGNIVEIDSFDAENRFHPSFARFNRLDDQDQSSIARYFMEPNYLGKANPWYSLYRTKLLKEYCAEIDFWQSKHERTFAFDSALVLGMLCRHHFAAIDEVLLKKRVERKSDRKGNPEMVEVNYSRPGDYEGGCREMADFDEHLDACRRFVAGTPHEALIETLIPYKRSLAETNTRKRHSPVSGFLRRLRK